MATDKKRRGRKNLIVEVTDDMIKQARKLYGLGLEQGMVADFFGVKRSCWYVYLEKYPELKKAMGEGRSKSVAVIADKLYQKALNGNTSAQIFFLKTKGKFTEKIDIGTDPDDKPKVDLNINVTDPVEAAKIYAKIMTGS